MNDDADGCLGIIIMGVIIFFVVKGCSSDDKPVEIKTDVTIESIMEVGTPALNRSVGEAAFDPAPLVEQENKLDNDVQKLEAQLEQYQNAD